ncbi:MAG: GNAT family acetyltransferase [Erysipelotrichaceae bacterium]|nr:MAG: GNAT family [Erysipelotrichaceae bacterium]TXT19033.1 MAG: GNAT family acetyltransferase [Erysipelotrichaceae bacterium]
MIRKAQTHDLKAIQDLCASDSSRLLFIDGDIAQNGLHTSYQDTWVDDVEGKIQGLFLRYHANFVFYMKEACLDHAGFEAILDQRIKMISACQKDIDMMPQYLKERYTFRTLYFCECDQLTNRDEPLNVQEVTVYDCADVVESISQIEEFRSSLAHQTKDERIQSMRERYASQKIHGFIIKEDNQVVAHASTSVETNSGAMIGAVFTLPDYRQKGYGRTVVSAITKYCLSKGQKPCLFYDNPKAGKIYLDLGYKTFDHWCLGSLKP